MWTLNPEDLAAGRRRRVTVELNSRAATWYDVLRGWRDDPGFRGLFTATLAEMPYPAFRWETQAVTAKTVTRPFEFVVLDSPDLAQPPDSLAFAEHFGNSNREVVVFPNLGADALMVVPCPQGPSAAYGHLASFVRGAPEAQGHLLWKSVAEAMLARLDSRPVWLSTAGGGVAWLHVRLDDRPKYYGYAPYRTP